MSSDILDNYRIFGECQLVHALGVKSERESVELLCCLGCCVGCIGPVQATAGQGRDFLLSSQGDVLPSLSFMGMGHFRSPWGDMEILSLSFFGLNLDPHACMSWRSLPCSHGSPLSCAVGCGLVLLAVRLSAAPWVCVDS